MVSSGEANAELRDRVRQQEVVAELGQRALEIDDLDQVMRDAAVAVSETLDTELCGILELLPAGDEAVVRECVGWERQRLGRVTAGADSAVGYTLHREDAVIVDDLRTEDRFSASGAFSTRDAISGISVVVGSTANPWGVLATYATEPREFTDQDANFVQSVANVLASAIENDRTQTELEEIYGRISDAFFALDDQWRFTYLNERAHELINPRGRELAGENVWEQFPKAIGRKFKSKYERAMYEQETVAFEEYYPDPLDSWFEVRAYPSESGLSVYFRDVTERKQRERELQRKERRFEAVFEDPNILVGLLEPDGTVLDINQTAMEYIDADLDAVTGEPFWGAPWWGEGDEVQDDVRRWVERAATGEYVDFEAGLTRPDGQQYTLNGVFRPVTDDDGEVVSVIVSDRDVTERREYERRLEQSEQRYRTLAESFPNGLVTLFDEDLRYTLAAGQKFDELPVSPEDVEDRTPREVWGEDVAEVLEPALRSALDGEETAVELAYVDREWIVHAVPISDEDGEVFAGMTMAQDITERKEYRRRLERTVEKLEESNERLESFASMLAHELRNPVTIGQIYSRQLRSGGDDETVGYVTEAFDRIEEMIDVMLVLTRGSEAIDAGQTVDLATAAREAWNEVDASDAELSVDVDATIQADETYIRHLFRNLFENSVEHGGSAVTIRVDELSDGCADEPDGGSADESVEGFYVADDGDGIPVDEREAVFEAGYTTAADRGGTGLGLAFVHEIADVYDWECSVTESDAGGARFEFRAGPDGN